MSSSGNLCNIKNIINFCAPIYSNPDYLVLLNKGISKIFNKCQDEGFIDLTMPILIEKTEN